MLQAEAQTTEYHARIPQDMIHLTNESGGSRAGSCASPNGDIICDELLSYPLGSYLSTHGCCYTLSPPVKNATYCWEFTPESADIEINSGWGITTSGSFSSWFSDFELYTCAPDCNLVGTGLVYSGLTPGDCYTWCFDTHMTGGGGGGGFTFLCPYVVLTGVLAVEFSSFDCLPSEEMIQLSWSTSSETNCESYQIMRSGDGINYEAIATVAGNGNSSQAHNYIYKDEHPLAGENYYYLEQYDFDKTMASITATIVCASDDEVLFEVYYNLMGEKISIETAPAGIYIKESITSRKKSRQLIHKS